MSYSRHRPAADLAALVETVWVQQAPASAATTPPTTVLPLGRAELLIHFGEPFEHWDGARFVRVPVCYAMGQRTRPLRVRATGATGLVLVSLWPWAAQALLGVPLESAIDTCIDLEDVVRRRASDRLRQRVHGAGSAHDRVAVTQEFLRAAIRDATPDPLVREAAIRINRSWGRTRIHKLAHDLGLSRRQFERRFVRASGTSPKQFVRIVRAQKALGLLRGGAGSLDVVYRCGYADQSHLIHELTALAGRTAGTLARTGCGTPLMRAFNTHGVSHFYNTAYL